MCEHAIAYTDVFAPSTPFPRGERRRLAQKQLPCRQGTPRTSHHMVPKHQEHREKLPCTWVAPLYWPVRDDRAYSRVLCWPCHLPKYAGDMEQPPRRRAPLHRCPDTLVLPFLARLAGQSNPGSEWRKSSFSQHIGLHLHARPPKCGLSVLSCSIYPAVGSANRNEPMKGQPTSTVGRDKRRSWALRGGRGKLVQKYLIRDTYGGLLT
jgi:hypothetical protein